MDECSALMMTAARDMTFARDGAQRIAGGALAIVRDLCADLEEVLPARAGVRLTGLGALAHHLTAGGAIGSVAASVLGAAAVPVRAILFDKTPASNWSLGWHQDRAIAVKERREVGGYDRWTLKSGHQHVEPPIALLNSMVTLRVHLDDVPATNAPLLVAPGSHRLGRVAERDVAAIVARCGSVACTAETGDIWLNATLILHASEAADCPRERRVLQLDYTAVPLPGGLEWLGV